MSAGRPAPPNTLSFDSSLESATGETPLNPIQPIPTLLDGYDDFGEIAVQLSPSLLGREHGHVNTDVLTVGPNQAPGSDTAGPAASDPAHAATPIPVTQVRRPFPARLVDRIRRLLRMRRR
ncbi:unnamed protein product [Peniophora sp. CBMAI 1063]|nr:unnamed protein product [Peniophora sp. CBMAI 1063]